MERIPHNKQEVSTRIRSALLLLLEAFHYADETNSDRWEFAIELEDLAALGLTRNDFRWLIRRGLVEHRREVTLEGDDGRAFRATGDLTFPEGTCFVLTEEGISHASMLCHATATCSTGRATAATAPGNRSEPVAGPRGTFPGVAPQKAACNLPNWDAERRTLCVNREIVKHFKWAAANQEAILAAFEEEGWPARIDDPLIPQPNQDSKRRLSDTIKCLNRKQKNALIHFHGDGTGEAVVWELVGQNGADGEPSG